MPGPQPRWPRRQLLMLGAACAMAQAGKATASELEPADPASQGLRADAVARALQAGESVPALRALLVARAGRVVAERYYAGASAAQRMPINSATKSVCGMLVGLALQDGSLASLDATVAELLPEAAAAHPQSPAASVTLRQIVTGRSGQVHDFTRYPSLVREPALPAYVLGLPPAPAAPGQWTYNDAMVALLAPILLRAQGANLATLAERQLFTPLGIEGYAWQRGADGQPLAPGGLVLRPRSLLKLAVLMADAGRWQGQPLLPPAWVADSLAPHGPAHWPFEPVSDVGYGQLWFTGLLHGQRVAWALGYGGQIALVVPAWKLAVVTLASVPPPHAVPAQNRALMALVAAMVEAAL